MDKPHMAPWEQAIFDGYTAGKKPTYDELEAALLGALRERNAAKQTTVSIAGDLTEIVVARMRGDTAKVLAAVDAVIAKSVKIVTTPSETLQ
ncbi:MAG: hypothetical protein ABI171_01075 [Collimonas sp.]|uniref:hypothetical protein n=1 Tax=Collimonas sp. TaxID=1963772 RepID=UPI00326451B8